MEKTNLTAKEAREVSDEGKKLINSLYKFVREEAISGKTVARFYCQDISTKLVEKIEKSLTDNGYSVSVYKDSRKYEYADNKFTSQLCQTIIFEISW